MTQKEVKQAVAVAKKRWETAVADLAEARKALDNIYVEAHQNKYPDGEFILERTRPYVYYGGNETKSQEEKYVLYWSSGKRNIGVRNISPGIVMRPGIYRHLYRPIKSRGNSNKITTYNSLEKLMAAARKFNVPQPLVEAFIEAYLFSPSDALEEHRLIDNHVDMVTNAVELANQKLKEKS